MPSTENEGAAADQLKVAPAQDRDTPPAGRESAAKSSAGKPPHIEAGTKQATKIEASVTINRPPQVVYEFWKDVRNHTKFMHKLKSVEPVDDTHSHWIMTTFYDMNVEWDAETINDHEGELIAWCTVGKPTVQQAGSVRFNAVPGNPNQTFLRLLALVVPPPGLRGAIGMAAAALFFEDPERALREDLRHLKEILEESPEEAPEMRITQ